MRRVPASSSARWSAIVSPPVRSPVVSPMETGLWPAMSGALAADHLTVALRRQLAAVVHEEAARAAELVRLHRQYLDGELLVGEIGTGQLEGLGDVGFVHVDDGRLRVNASGLEFLQAVLAEVDLVATRRVVVGGHRLSHSPIPCRPGCNADSRRFAPVVNYQLCQAPVGSWTALATAQETYPASAVPYRHRSFHVCPRAQICSQCDRGDTTVGGEAPVG